MPYQVRDVEQVVAEFRDEGQPYGVFIDRMIRHRLTGPVWRPLVELTRRRHMRFRRRLAALPAGTRSMATTVVSAGV